MSDERVPGARSATSTAASVPGPAPAPDRLRAAPAQRFAGAEHVYDLAEVARRLRAEPRAAIDGHRQITIAHHGSVALVMFDFEAGGRLIDHVADGLVTIHSLRGRVRVRASGGEHALPAGTLLVLAPGVVHDLHADEPSEVLLTVHLEAGPGSGATGPKPAEG